MLKSELINQNEEIIHTIESTDSRSAKNKAIALVCALLLTGGLIGGYLFLRWKNERNAALNQPKTEQKVVVNSLANILVDEPVPKGSQAILGGTIVNTSNKNLDSLSIELELTKRNSEGVEKKVLSIEPKNLAPGQSGRYSFTFLSKEFKAVRITRLLSVGSSEIAFKQTEGAKRPLEKPRPQQVTVVVEKSKPKKGEDFINTPDTPMVIK